MNVYGHAIPEINRDAVNALADLVKPEVLELPSNVKQPSDKK